VKIVDISLPLSSGMPFWPGSQGFKLSWLKRLSRGDNCNNSQFVCDTHAGTHLDAPLHFSQSGRAVDQLSLNILTGPCLVIHLPRIKEITPEVLSKLSFPDNARRLLFRTDNSNLWSEARVDFVEDFVALNADAADWIVRKRIRLIGIDYLSIGSFNGGAKTHQILSKAGVIVLEGLNLSGAESGEYELICLPLRIAGAEGAPARAVLRKPE